MKKGLKIFLVVIGILIGLLLLVNIVAGPVVKSYLEKHSVELCNRVVKIKHVRINVFTGKVAVIGMDVKEENGKDRFLYFDKLKVHVSLPRLLGKTVRVKKVLLKGLNAKVVQDGIRFNFSDIIDLYTKDKPQKPDTPSKWSVDIGRIRVKGCSVLYKDVRVGSCFDTKDVNITIPRLHLKQGATRLHLTTAFRNGGDFALKGKYDIQKGDFDAKVNMHDLSLDMAWPYLHKLLNVGGLSGNLQGDAHVSGCVKRIEEMIFSGTVGMTNFKAINADKSPLVSFSALNMDMENVDLGKRNAKVNTVSLNDLVVHYDIYEGGNTLSLLTGAKSAPDSTSAEERRVDTTSSKSKSSAIQYVVKKLNITNGKILFADHTVSPQEQNFEVSGIQIQSDNLSSSGSSSPVILKSKLGSTGELTCSAHIDPFDLSNADADISIKNLKLTDFSPYSLYYLAYPLEDGLLAFTSNISIKDNILDSQNGLDIYKPKFGKKDKSIKPAAAKIPMRAAVYIITDRKNHAKMDLPVQGDVSSPDFSFRKVIWKTFLNLVVKIAASPVDYIAKALAGDETFKPMLMPMDNPSELTIEHNHQLNAIADYLKQSSEMSLEVAVTPYPDASLSAAEANAVKQQSFQTVQKYLAQQGVPSSRVVLMDEEKPHKSKDKLRIDFNLKFEGE